MMTFVKFKKTFIDCDQKLSKMTKLPKTMDEYSQNLYIIYLQSRREREEEILNTFTKIIKS